jgi:hypothetical protein
MHLYFSASSRDLIAVSFDMTLVALEVSHEKDRFQLFDMNLDLLVVQQLKVEEGLIRKEVVGLSLENRAVFEPDHDFVGHHDALNLNEMCTGRWLCYCIGTKKKNFKPLPAMFKFPAEVADTKNAVQQTNPFSHERYMFWAGVFLGLLVGANIGVVLACLLGGTARREAATYGTDPGTPPGTVVVHEAGEDPVNQPFQSEPVTYLDRYPHA